MRLRRLPLEGATPVAWRSQFHGVRLAHARACGGSQNKDRSMTSTTPRVTQMRVIPVAGRDSMLLNLSGAHGPFFTRNLLLLTDNAGHTGVGEVPGGEKIRQTLEEALPLVVGQTSGADTT